MLVTAAERPGGILFELVSVRKPGGGSTAQVYLSLGLFFPGCLPWYWAGAGNWKPLSGAERRGVWWRERKRGGKKRVKLFAESSLLATHTDAALYRLHPFSCNTRQIDIATGSLLRICV